MVIILVLLTNTFCMLSVSTYDAHLFSWSTILCTFIGYFFL